MKIRDAKLLFNAGALSKCIVIPAALAKGYEIVIHTKEQGCNSGESISTKRGSARLFKTVDTALKAASGIGFTIIEIRLE